MIVIKLPGGVSGTNEWKNALKPKAIMLAKEGAELGKDLLKENKGNIQKIVSKQSQNI